MSDLVERCWKAYQLGQGSADHTAKEVFREVVGQLADEIERLQAENERLAAMIKEAFYSPREIEFFEDWLEINGYRL